MDFNLEDRSVLSLKNKIRDSFRVRPNRNPIYVEVGGYLERVLSEQNQVIFGRRGSGKSCLIVKGLTDLRSEKDSIAIYTNADNVKRLQYPDLLIRLLLDLMREVVKAVPWYKKLSPNLKKIKAHIKELESLLDQATEADITEGTKEESQRSIGSEASSSGLAVNANRNTVSSREKTAAFHEKKLDKLERRLIDYVSSMEQALALSGKKAMLVFIDDFYLVPKKWQAYVADYIHRLFRNSNFFFKIATIRHRTTLYYKDDNETIGLELGQDVEELNLDKTLQDLPATKAFLSRMLDKIGDDAGVDDISQKLFNPEALEKLTLASGGVARDFLNILVDAIEESVAANSKKWLTPSFIWKASSRQSYRSKLKSLRDEAGAELSALEKVYTDLINYCLKEKKKTAFLISQEDAQKYPYEHELIQQLMDYKLIHVIEPDTSASSGRSGRHEAYTLDFAIFMEPRLRGIEHVEFWVVDEQRHRKGLREAPIYSLDRAKSAHKLESGKNIEASISEIQAEYGEQENVPPKTAKGAKVVKAVRDLFEDSN